MRDGLFPRQREPARAPVHWQEEQQHGADHRGHRLPARRSRAGARARSRRARRWRGCPAASHSTTVTPNAMSTLRCAGEIGPSRRSSSRDPRRPAPSPGSRRASSVKWKYVTRNPKSSTTSGTPSSIQLEEARSGCRQCGSACRCRSGSAASRSACRCRRSTRRRRRSASSPSRSSGCPASDSRPLVRCATIDSPIGNIIAVVAVLLIHIERPAVTPPNTNRMRAGLPPTSARRQRAVKRCAGRARARTSLRPA